MEGLTTDMSTFLKVEFRSNGTSAPLVVKKHLVYKTVLVPEPSQRKEPTFHVSLEDRVRTGAIPWFLIGAFAS